MKLFLSQAKSSDFAEMCQIFSDIYSGIDYLPYCYQSWIEEEEKRPQHRKNILLKDEDENNRILGYQSLMFQVMFCTYF